MQLSDYLAPDNILLDLAPVSKVALLTQLSAVAAQKSGCEPADIARRLLNREELGSTGIGEGVAIPHAGIDGLKTTICIFARLARPIDFDSVDETPVDLVFLLLNPGAGGGGHLNILSHIARLIRDPQTVTALRNAPCVELLRHSLSGSCGDGD